MATPHKYADVIKAWADGAEVEVRSNTIDGNYLWHALDVPVFRPDGVYRIKKVEHSPVKRDVVLRGLTREEFVMLAAKLNHLAADETAFCRYIPDIAAVDNALEDSGMRQRNVHAASCSLFAKFRNAI